MKAMVSEDISQWGAWSTGRVNYPRVEAFGAELSCQELDRCGLLVHRYTESPSRESWSVTRYAEIDGCW